MKKSDVLESIINTFHQGNKAAFSRHIGIQPQTLQGWLQRGKVEYDVIFSHYPDINPIWLLTNGEEGDIIKKVSAEEVSELQRLRTENDLLRQIVNVPQRKKGVS